MTVSTNTPIQYGIYCQNVYNYIHIHKYIHIHTHTHIYIYLHSHTYIYTLHIYTPHLYSSNSLIHFTLKNMLKEYIVTTMSLVDMIDTWYMQQQIYMVI